LVTLEELLQTLKNTDFATAIRESGSWFPWLEAIHVLAVTILIGSVALLELRLIGVASLHRSVTRVLKDVLPITWSAFAVSVVSGFFLFSSNAPTYAANPFFLGKLVLLAAAGLNAFGFHAFVERSIARWDSAARTPVPARLSGIFSLMMWVGIVVCGRWVGFTLVPTP
jgi:uncharacterized protein DUF6644